MPILWSVASTGVVFVILGELPRLITRRILPPRQHKYAAELIAAFQYSACVFEIAVIGKYYSTNVAIACSFCLLILKNSEYIFEAGSCAGNPCPLLEGIVCKRKKPWFINFLLTVGLQFAGAALAFPVMRLAWQLTSSEFHFKQLNSEVTTTLNVPASVGFAIEVVTTFLVTMVHYLTRGGLRKFNPVLRATSCICLALSLTGTTGVWMSPVLATVHSFIFVTDGELLLEHVFIFWVGPIIGTLFAIAMNSKLFQQHIDPKPKPIAKTILKQLKKKSSNGVLHRRHKANTKTKTISNGERKTA